MKKIFLFLLALMFGVSLFADTMYEIKVYSTYYYKMCKEIKSSKLDFIPYLSYICSKHI